MNHWNVPVEVVYTIKQLVMPILKERILTISYKEWVETLSQNDILDTKENRILLESIMERIQDKQKDYHIMKLEKLIAFDVEDGERLTLREKMNKVYDKCDFSNYLYLYSSDINKLKQLFLEMVRHVSIMQTNNYVVFKYGSEVNFNDLWNEFYMECRGVVIDLEDVALVSSPYRKFFNLNENWITSIDRISQLIREATEMNIKNKEDGSMISVTKYKGELIVSTPGFMESVQAKWAKDFLYKHYPNFIKEMPEQFTFIFEAIYPDNRIVVDYEGAEKMVLTNMRSTIDGTYFKDNVVRLYSKMYGFPIPYYENKELSTLLEEAKNIDLHPANKKEGWVFNIKTPNEELFFKLKCEDYCEMHQIIGGFNSPKIIFEHIKNDTFDDFIAKVPEITKSYVLDISKIIGERIDYLKEDVDKHLKLIPKDIIFSTNEIKRSIDVRNFIKEEIAPLIHNRLSKNIRKELEESLLSKVFGKEPFIDKYVQKEFERLWLMIPADLQEQKEYKKKEGRLLQFIYKNIPSAYQSLAFNYVRGLEVDVLSLIDVKEMDFSFLQTNKEELEV